MNISNIRREYTKSGLMKSDVPSHPFILFEQWLQKAIQAQVNEPTAVLVSTVSPEGRPSSRTVLLKELSDAMFVFYTNYNSRKGMQIAQNPFVSLSFVWHELERQVHIEGKAEKLSAVLSDAYFKIRPYKSRIGARISPQSKPIRSRTEIMGRFVKEMALHAGREIERPEYWGGYGVTPDRIEFWQGRESRLHDRILYTLQADGSWDKERLAP